MLETALDIRVAHAHFENMFKYSRSFLTVHVAVFIML